MSGLKIILKENKIAIVITLLILVLGSILFFWDIESNFLDRKIFLNASQDIIYDEISLKAVFSEDGEMFVFANVDSEVLKNYTAENGKNVPGKSSIVLGNNVVEFMIDNGFFENIGDKVDDLFGLNITVAGVLKKTNTIIDDLIFIREKQFNKILGEDDLLFVGIDQQQIAKLIYTYDVDNNINIKLRAGALSDYKDYTWLDKNYYPLILGYKEAELLKERTGLGNRGDVLNIFEKDFIVVGIFDKTNTVADNVYFTTLERKDFE